MFLWTELKTASKRRAEAEKWWIGASMEQDRIWQLLLLLKARKLISTRSNFFSCRLPGLKFLNLMHIQYTDCIHYKRPETYLVFSLKRYTCFYTSAFTMTIERCILSSCLPKQLISAILIQSEFQIKFKRCSAKWKIRQFFTMTYF